MTVIAASIRRGAKIATALVLIATLHIFVLVARAGAHTGRHHAFTYNLWGGSAHHNGALAPAIRVVAHERFMRDGGHNPLAFALQEACDSVNYFSQTDYLQSAFSGRFTVYHGPTIWGSNPGSACQYYGNVVGAFKTGGTPQFANLPLPVDPGLTLGVAPF